MQTYYVQQIERASAEPVSPRVTFGTLEEATLFRTRLAKAVDYNKTKLVIGQHDGPTAATIATAPRKGPESLRSRRSTGKTLMSLLREVVTKEHRPEELWSFNEDGRVISNTGALDLHRSTETQEWDLLECTGEDGQTRSLIDWPGLAKGAKLTTREMESFLRGMLASGQFVLAEQPQ